MISVLGWTIIIVLLLVAGSTMFWLGLRIGRLARPGLRAPWWAAAMGIIASSVALWVLIPKAVPLVLR